MLRHLFFKYVLVTFPKLRDILTCYGTWKWYHGMYGMDEHGRIIGRGSEESSDSEDEKHGEDANEDDE